MTDPGSRHCRRCGTGLLAGLPFCPKCGLNNGEPGDTSAPPEDHGHPPVDALGRRFDAPEHHTFIDRSSRGPAIVAGALIVAAGLVLFGLLMRPEPGIGPTSTPLSGASGGPGPGASLPSPPALIAGLTIQSPPDGQVIATKEVTVIGLAPPGLSVTRDVSFGLDQHATADGTGHWAISVSLNNGQNDLVFRIGDDHSTEQRLRVVFKP
jgi:hypothetical protein